MRKGPRVISRVKDQESLYPTTTSPFSTTVSMLLAFILLIFWRVNKPLKFHIDMDLYSQDQGNLQKDKLELTDTYKKSRWYRNKTKRAQVHTYIRVTLLTNWFKGQLLPSFSHCVPSTSSRHHWCAISWNAEELLYSWNTRHFQTIKSCLFFFFNVSVPKVARRATTRTYTAGEGGKSAQAGLHFCHRWQLTIWSVPA